MCHTYIIYNNAPYKLALRKYIHVYVVLIKFNNTSLIYCNKKGSIDNVGLMISTACSVSLQRFKTIIQIHFISMTYNATNK